MKASSVRRLLVLAAAMCCTILSAQSNRRTPSTVVLDPAKGSPFNDGVFEGWGTSLCWWANRVGYSDKLTDLAVDAFFDQTNGLKLNIVRYNIGGGDDPTHRHITRSDSNMPGFAQPFLSEKGEICVDDDGIAIWRYDWERDKNQMNVLTKILARNPDAIVEAFSNSPPYFMTSHGELGHGLVGAPGPAHAAQPECPQGLAPQLLPRAHLVYPLDFLSGTRL